MRLLIVIIALLAFYNGSVFGESPKPEPLQKELQAKEPLTWGEFDPGKGMVIGKNELASMSVSFYALGRYLNQQPQTQSYNDHLGNKKEVNSRNDFELHRVLIWLKGYAYDPKFVYNAMFWTVNATKNFYLIGQLAYKFDPKFELAVGIDGLPGVRSLNGQHPYFLGTDRHLGDEFFKPSFTMGITARGQLSKSLFYRVMLGNNISEIGVTTADMTGDLAYGGSIWVLPTGEFGPRNGYGDFEMHSELSSRYGISFTQMRQNGYAQPFAGMTPKTTTIRSSDGVNIYDPGALAPGVTVKNANYTIISPDMGFKYQGLFVDFNYYFRWLDGFSTYGGKVPQEEIFDHGTMVQVAKIIKPQTFELYSAYSYIWGEFNNPWEIAVGANYYPKKTRNWRLNMMINHIEQSPVQSGFGYYSAGQTGETIAIATDVLF
jgi:hypothetical protein